jgi:hypothetical protein
MITKYSIDATPINTGKVASLFENFVPNASFKFFFDCKQKAKSFIPYLLFVSIFFTVNKVHSQIENGGDLYIGDNSALYIDAQSFSFGHGTITTSRTTLDYGVLSMSDGASWIGASTTRFVDGYVQTHSATTFVLPVGQSGVYAPIQVIPSTSEGVEAAYFRSTPNSIGSVLGESISSISSIEYWDIKSRGVKAGISLSWRPSSAISDLTSSSLSNLTIVGWNGSAWVIIPSMLDEYSIQGEISSLFSGSISSTAQVDLSVYSAFSVGSTTKQLLVAKFDKVDLIVYVNRSHLFIEASQPITALIIYDLMGRVIFSERLNGGLEYNIPFIHADEVYITKIELNNGSSIITKKIINKN